MLAALLSCRTAEITARAPSGEPTEQQLAAFYLEGDAPR